MKMNKIILTATAFLGLITGVRAGTLGEDMIVQSTETAAANTQLEAAEDAMDAKGLKAALPQLEAAIKRSQAAAEFGLALCMRGVSGSDQDRAYYKAHTDYWTKLKVLLAEDQKELTDIRALILEMTGHRL
jgi:hypothetical protein